MSESNVSPNELFVGRQPIMDGAGNLFAYEILFRSSKENFALIKDQTQATSTVIINTLNNIGARKLIGKKKGFINFNRQMLLSKAYEILEPKYFVVEILEDIDLDDALVDVLTDAKQKGYMLALDDFDMSDEMIQKFDKVMHLIEFLKVDVLAFEPEKIKNAASLVSNSNIKLIAEKVEDQEMFKELLNCQYDFFQGYYFAKPEVLSEKAVDPTLTAIMDIITQIQRAEEIPKIEEEFKKTPQVMVNLLKFINSASMGMRNEIASIRQALTLIGAQKLKQWLMMMVYARPGVTMADSPSLDNALKRGKVMELICDKLGIAKGEVAFLTGIMSHIDCVYEMPLNYLLRELRIDPEIQKALLKGEGVIGDMFSLIKSLEDHKEEEVKGLLKKLNLDPKIFANVNVDAYGWVGSVL